MPKDPNWLAVERDYCAGVFPLDAICARHGVSEAQLKKYVKERGLKRDDFLQDNRKFLTVIAPDDVREAAITGRTIQDVFTPDELEKAALITATSMVDAPAAIKSGIALLSVLPVDPQAFPGLSGYLTLSFSDGTSTRVSADQAAALGI